MLYQMKGSGSGLDKASRRLCSKPETLQQALEQALEVESIYQANKQRSKVVREIQLEATPTAQVNKTHLLQDFSAANLHSELTPSMNRCSFSSHRPEVRRNHWLQTISFF